MVRARRRTEIPAAELAVADEDARLLVLSRAGHPGWRLMFDQPVDPAIRALLPRPPRYGSWIDRIGLAKATAILGAIAAVVLFVGYTAPAWLAPLVPESWERNLGTAMVGDFGDYACRDPAATQALARMAARIEPPHPGRQPIAMTLIDVGIFNAAALPGGQIVIFDGALREAKNPDAMAGILAHEIAHVRRRHVTQALIRELGIGALIRLFAGDIGANAQQLVSLSYTRANEYEADGDAIAALARAKIDPRPTGEFFRTLEQGRWRGVWRRSNSSTATPTAATGPSASSPPIARANATRPSIPPPTIRRCGPSCPAKRDAEQRARKTRNRRRTSVGLCGRMPFDARTLHADARDRADRASLFRSRRRPPHRLSPSRAPAGAPTVLFLPGYASDMEGAKAEAIDAFCAARGIGCLRLDYSGTGSTGGDFADGTLDRWLEEVLAAIDLLTEGPLIVAGSSMGGWLALHAAHAPQGPGQGACSASPPRPTSPTGAITQEEKEALLRDGKLERANPYGPEPSVTWRGFWESGAAHRLLYNPIDLTIPIRLVHGEQDEDVPMGVPIKLMADLRSADVQLRLIKGAGHRLSEPHEIHAILDELHGLVERIA